MSEHLPLLEAVIREVDAGRSPALCAVLETRGSTPQSPGALLAVQPDFSILGTVGGGCVEAEVRRRAFELLRTTDSALFEFVLDHDYGWDDGLICGGKMTIGVAKVTPDDAQAITQAVQLARKRKPSAFPMEFKTNDQTRKYNVRLEVPPTLIIAGAGHVGAALARWAIDLDFHVVVIDDRADFASPDRFDPRVELRVGEIADQLRQADLDEATYIVIVTRGHRHDHEALEAVVNSTAGYIGLIGSRRKAKMIMADLAESGVSADTLARVHTPIGLSIHAVTVPEIAISILAELIQVRRSNTPPLVERIS